MKKTICCFLVVWLLLIFAQQDSIQSGKYSWIEPTASAEKNILSTILFQGKAVDMKFLQMSANALLPSTTKSALQVPQNEERLLLVKAGSIMVAIGDSTWKIGPGSVALLMPGEKYFLQNSTKDTSSYYLMKYRSKQPIDVSRGKKSGGSIVMDWHDIVFKPHERGGIRNYFERSTAMCKRLEMHVTTLKEGLKSHEPHTHRAEEIVLVISNKTEMQIGEKFFKGADGDIYYLDSNVPHAIKNDGVGNCIYFAFQFE